MHTQEPHVPKKSFDVVEHEMAARTCRKVYDMYRESLKEAQVDKFFTSSSYEFPAPLQARLTASFGASFLDDMKHVLATACPMRKTTAMGEEHFEAYHPHVEERHILDAFITERKLHETDSEEEPNEETMEYRKKLFVLSNLIIVSSHTLYVERPVVQEWEQDRFGRVSGPYIMMSHVLMKWLIAERELVPALIRIDAAYQYIKDDIMQLTADTVQRFLKLHVINSFLLSVRECGVLYDDMVWEWKGTLVKTLFLEHLGNADVMLQLLQDGQQLVPSQTEHVAM